MNTKLTKQLVAMFLVSLAGTTHADQTEPAVAVKTEGMPPHVAEKVREKAAQGSTALRRYVDSTRMINALDFRSILREEASPGMARNERVEKPVQVARGDRR